MLAAFDLMVRPLVDEDSRVQLGDGEWLCEDLNIVNDFMGLEATAGGDNNFGIRIDNSSSELFGRKTAKHNGMDGSDPITSPSGKEGLRDHGHVYNDSISFSDSLFFE